MIALTGAEIRGLEARRFGKAGERQERDAESVRKSKDGSETQTGRKRARARARRREIAGWYQQQQRANQRARPRPLAYRGTLTQLH